MIYLDRDALICDLAEYYHIYDYRTFKASYIAILAKGLPDCSRIKLKLQDREVSMDRLLWASIADACQFIAWSKTESAQNGMNPPKSIVKAFLGETEQSNSDVMAFSSPEEFEKARAQLIGE